MEIENVLSLFNGMGCGYEALNRAGIKFKNYYASEVDKYANQFVSQNYPDTIQLGDVRHINADNLPKICLLIGGSPCQDFSFAGKRNGATTECKIEITTLEQYLKLKQEGFVFKGQSYLFWEFVRLLKEMRKKNPNIKFMLENVRMTEKWKNVIDQALGVKHICIDSKLVSAQGRVRFYWANWENTQPEDRGIFLEDVVEDDALVDRDKSRAIIGSIGRTTHREYFKKNQGQLVYNAIMLSNIYGGFKEKRPRVHLGKSVTIRTAAGGGHIPSLIIENKAKHFTLEKLKECIRKVTPLECARLQGFKDTINMEGISNTQLYKMFGNGFNIDTVAHIFRGLKNCESTANTTAESAQGKLL